MQNKVAIVFDFDDTLAPDSSSSYLESIGVDVKSFWKERVDGLRAQGWDPIPAYLYSFIKESQSRPEGERITKESFVKWGEKVQLFKDASKIFDELINHTKEVNPEVDLEFYCISSGIGDIIRNTRISKYFKAIWTCDFHYNEADEIEFPKNVISFTDKTRYLFYITKGLIKPEHHTLPFEVNRFVPRNELRIPFQQMIFVGDGYTDIPCFSLVSKNGGRAIGVYDPHNRDHWGRAWGFVEDKRVMNLAPADYGPQSSLTHSLIMALSVMVGSIGLERHVYQA